MSLTGLPLLAASAVGSAGVIVLAILTWRRGGQLRLLTRTGCLLLCEALVVFTGALALNRTLGLYPSWSTLAGRAVPPAGQAAVADPATSLEAWLRGKSAAGAHSGLVFAWKPAAVAGWHLSVLPTVYVPPAYFTGTALRFPVVVVVAPPGSTPAQGAWDNAKIADLARGSAAGTGPAVLVFLRMSRPDDGKVLCGHLPDRLDADLRVSRHGWAVVGVGDDAADGLTALSQDPGRYRTAALVAAGADALPHTLMAQAARVGLDQLVVQVAAAPASWAGLAAGGQDHGGPMGIAGPVQLEPVGRPVDRLIAALRWIYPQLAAPLAPPVTTPVGTVPVRSAAPAGH